MTRILTVDELRNGVQNMMQLAAKIHLYASVIRSATPEKNVAIENIKSSAQNILDLLEVLEK
jgi:hypothetical protein